MERGPVALLILGIGVDSRMSKQEPNEFKRCRVRRRARSVQYRSSKRVPGVHIYHRCTSRVCRCVAGERRVPLSPGAAPHSTTGCAQLVLACGLGLGLGLGMSGSLALLEGSLEFSLLAESKVSMKHAHISQVLVRSESLRSLDEDAANLVDADNSRGHKLSIPGAVR